MTNILNIPVFDIDYCFKMGYDCEMNGANETNCHFAIFATEEKMHAWENGKKAAKKEKEEMGKKRTPNQLNAVIRKYVRKWKTNLFLTTWSIDFYINDYLGDGEDGHKTCGTCNANWKYFHINLKFSHELMAEMEESEIEEIVIHELLHAVVNEMREEGIGHEERVVSHLTMILNWMEGRCH